MIIKLYRLNNNWTSAAPEPIRVRHLAITTKRPRHVFVLIPGGRWLLSAQIEQGLKILYHDLDDPEAEGTLLYEDYSDEFYHEQIQLTRKKDGRGFSLLAPAYTGQSSKSLAKNGLPRRCSSCLS